MRLRKRQARILIVYGTRLLIYISAAQNEVAIKNLKLGMLIASVLSILLRALFRRGSLTSIPSVLLYAITYVPTFFLSRYLTTIGQPKRDATGALVSPGEDLNQPGLTEYAFDVIYVTCKYFRARNIDFR
jgi:hypothetical protein